MSDKRDESGRERSSVKERDSESSGVVSEGGFESESGRERSSVNVPSAARTENEKILATNASSEAPLERQKMIILFMKIRLLSLQSRAICN